MIEANVAKLLSFFYKWAVSVEEMEEGAMSRYISPVWFWRKLSRCVQAIKKSYVACIHYSP